LKNNTGLFRTIVSIPPPKKVLKAHPLNLNVLLIATALNGHVSIDIYNVDSSSEEMEVFLVDTIPLEKQESQVGVDIYTKSLCCLHTCDNDSVFSFLL